MTIGAITTSHLQKYKVGLPLLALGAATSFYGTYLTHKLTSTANQLRDTLTRKELEIETAANKRVFLLVAAFMEEWQIELEFEIIQALRNAELSCTILVPAHNYEYGEHQALQREAEADAKNHLGGLVIIPVWGAEKAQELIDFARRLAKPVVFVDQNPPLPNDQIPSNVSYVSVSDAEGGELAADAVLELEGAEAFQRILVMAGPARFNRQNCFDARLRSRLPKCELVISTDGVFNRDVTEKIASELLIRALENRQPFDVVFCTTDSMTVGCLNAIAKISDWKGKGPPKIVGYDGIASTRRLVTSGNSPIARIVVQDPKEVARASVDQLLLLHHAKNPERSYSVPPYLFPRLQTRRANKLPPMKLN